MTGEREPEAAIPAIVERLEGVAARLGGVERAVAGEERTFARAGRPFARASGERLAFRLDPAVVRAALRTPDTAASPEGPEWVQFRPRRADRFSVDRAVSWFELAWRRAAPPGG